MLRIWIKEGARYREIDNGPFPIKLSELTRARDLFTREFSLDKPLTGARLSPQTAARDILKAVCPYLTPFDCLMLGFVVSSDSVRVRDENKAQNYQSIRLARNELGKAHKIVENNS